MIDGTVDIHNVDGSHTYSLNGSTSPLNDFDVQPTMRTDTSRQKPMMPGVWPTRSMVDNYTIHIEGALFADTSADLWTARKALILALFGVPDAVPTDEKMGTLYVTPEGETEQWYVDYTITGWQNPLRGNYPALTEFILSLATFDPWFIGATSGNKYSWG